MLVGKNSLMFAVRRCSNKIEDVNVNYKLPEVLKDIESRSSERIQSMKSNLESKIDSKIDNLGGMVKADIGQVKGDIGQVKGDIGALSGQVKGQSIGFGIFGGLVGTIVGIIGKISYDAMQKKQDK